MWNDLNFIYSRSSVDSYFPNIDSRSFTVSFSDSISTFCSECHHILSSNPLLKCIHKAEPLTFIVFTFHSTQYSTHTTLKVPDKKPSEPDMYGNMTHNQTPPPNRALQVRILIPMGASGYYRIHRITILWWRFAINLSHSHPFLSSSLYLILLISSPTSFLVIHDVAEGVMIGRQGSVIKSMSEQSSCHMQLAEMNDPYDTKERIMIINGKNGSLEDLIHVSNRDSDLVDSLSTNHCIHKYVHISKQ